MLSAADHCAKLAGDFGHFLAVETLAVQDRDFPLGAADGIVNKVEFDLEFLALLDLGAIGFKQGLGAGDLAWDRSTDGCRCCAVSGAGHLGPDGAQLRHDLAMHGTDVSVNDYGHRHVAEKCFFDTKTLAMNRHEIFTDL